MDFESGGRCTIKIIGENNIKVSRVVQKFCNSGISLSKQSFFTGILSNLSETKLKQLYEKEVLKRKK